MARRRATESKALEPIVRWKAAQTLDDLTKIARYRTEGRSEQHNRRLVFNSNSALWGAIFEAIELSENVQIELRDFWLSEWLPLRPGLFHTSSAAESRRIAMETSTIRPDDASAPEALRAWPRPVDGALKGGRDHGNQVRLFDPNGKMSMIDGGIGCVRLKPLVNRATHRWLFGASNTGVMHEGLPVALEDRWRDHILKDVRRSGAVKCSMRGTLRFVPSEDALGKTYGQGIPQIYLEVSDIMSPHPRSNTAPPIEVTAVATFLSRSGQFGGLNASYVTFFADSNGDLEEAVGWLEEVYVRRAYEGRIVTDFDEQTQRFSTATFSLNKLMNGLASRKESNDVFDELELDSYDRNHLVSVLDRRGIYVSGDAYFIRQAGAVGPHARASGTTFNTDE